MQMHIPAGSYNKIKYFKWPFIKNPHAHSSLQSGHKMLCWKIIKLGLAEGCKRLYKLFKVASSQLTTNKSI